MDDSIYQQTILDLARAADGAGRLDAADASATVDNPVCGDRVTLDLTMEGGTVAAVGHSVRGCVLCEAAATVIARRARGEAPEALRKVRNNFEEMIRGGAPAPADWPDLAAFEPVRAVRSRHECVLLPFSALTEALAKAEAGRTGPDDPP